MFTNLFQKLKYCLNFTKLLPKNIVQLFVILRRNKKTRITHTWKRERGGTSL